MLLWIIVIKECFFSIYIANVISNCKMAYNYNDKWQQQSNKFSKRRLNMYNVKEMIKETVLCFWIRVNIDERAHNAETIYGKILESAGCFIRVSASSAFDVRRAFVNYCLTSMYMRLIVTSKRYTKMKGIINHSISHCDRRYNQHWLTSKNHW